MPPPHAAVPSGLSDTAPLRMDLSPDTRVSASDDLALADLGDEAVLLDPESGKYFALNAVAVRIVELALEGSTVGGMVDRLHDEFEVERRTLQRDVESFVTDLGRRRILLLDQG